MNQNSMDTVAHIIAYLQAGREAASVQVRVDVGMQGGEMPHQHDYWEIKGVNLDGGHEGPRQIIVSPPGVVHSSFSISRRRHELTFMLMHSRFVCCFLHHGVGGSLAPARSGGLSAVYPLLTAIQGYADDGGELPPPLADDVRRLLLAVFINILERAGRKVRNETDPVDTSRWFMEGNFADTSLNVGRIAEIAGQSPQNLNRLFRVKMGSSVWKCLMKMRLRHARELLDSTSMTVLEVAHLSGFADRSNFSKYFARAYGVSPAAYRRRKQA